MSEFKTLDQKKKDGSRRAVVDWSKVKATFLGKTFDYSSIKQFVVNNWPQKKTLYYSEFLRVVKSWNSASDTTVLFRRDGRRVVYKLVVDKKSEVKKKTAANKKETKTVDK